MTGIAQLPGFRESLELLRHDQEFSLDDIGMMFNVSRERIRQLLAREGRSGSIASPGLNSIRCWDDTLHQFRPVSKRVLKDKKRCERMARDHDDRMADRDERRALIVAAIHRLTEELQRKPVLREVTDALGINGSGGLVSRWRGPGSRSYKGVLAQIWAAAGVSPRPRGYRGHLAPRKPSRFCRFGHEYTEADTYKSGRNRTCRACMQFRHLRRSLA